MNYTRFCMNWDECDHENLYGKWILFVKNKRSLSPLWEKLQTKFPDRSMKIHKVRSTKYDIHDSIYPIYIYTTKLEVTSFGKDLIRFLVKNKLDNSLDYSYGHYIRYKTIEQTLKGYYANHGDTASKYKLPIPHHHANITVNTGPVITNQREGYDSPPPAPKHSSPSSTSLTPKFISPSNLSPSSNIFKEQLNILTETLNTQAPPTPSNPPSETYKE